MTKPTIHLNGSSPEALVDNYEKAFRAIRTAEGALQDAAPHGRDYYPQGDSAFWQAYDEHQKRMDKLRSIREELQEIWESIINRDT